MIFTLIPSVTDTSVSFRHNHNHKHNSNYNYNRNHIHSHNTLVVPLPSSLSSSLSLSLSCRCMFVFLSLLLFLCFGFGFGFGFVSAQCNPQDPNSNGVPGGTPSTQALVMWVSSSTHTGALGGRVGANALCTSMQPASWTSAGITSQAMLSYSDQNLIEALPANFDIRNTKGQCIAADREDLFSGLLLGDLVFDQNRQSPGADINVITATNNQGYKAGLGLIPQNSPAEFYKGTDSPNKYCNDFTDDSAALTVSSLGKLKPGNDDIITQWIQYWTDTDAQGQCAQQNHIYCITSSPAPVHTVSQDPQFVGLQGQRFQVHGIPEEYFNLVSHPFFQLNSHFTYLATGICNYNDTACWSHPGTYVDELGLMLPGYEIGIFAGEHQHGLTVTVNGQTITQKTHTTTTTSSTSPFPFNAQFPLRIDNDTINSPHTAWLDPQPQPLSNSASASASASASRSVQSDSDSDIDSDNLSCTSSACWLLSSSISVSFLSHVHVVIDTPVATLDIYNADHFFNFALELRAPRLLLAGAPLDRVPPTPSRAHTHGHARAVAGSRAAGTGTGTGGVASAAISPATSPHPIFPMHGLVGQTWKNVKYPHGRLYAGEVDDYMLSDRRLFSTNFVYNEYQY